MWKPVIVLPLNSGPESLRSTQPSFSSFAIQINSEEGEVVRGLIFELLDHYLGLPKGDWPAAVTAVRQGNLHEGLKVQQAALARPAGAPPSVPLDQFVGTYRDPWYGDVVVARDKAGLTIDFRSTPRMSGRLRPYRYNSFVTDLTDKSIEPAAVNFALDSEGKAERVTMLLLSPVADLVGTIAILICGLCKRRNKALRSEMGSGWWLLAKPHGKQSAGRRCQPNRNSSPHDGALALGARA